MFLKKTCYNWPCAILLVRCTQRIVFPDDLQGRCGQEVVALHVAHIEREEALLRHDPLVFPILDSAPRHAGKAFPGGEHQKRSQTKGETDDDAKTPTKVQRSLFFPSSALLAFSRKNLSIRRSMIECPQRQLLPTCLCRADASGRGPSTKLVVRQSTIRKL